MLILFKNLLAHKICLVVGNVFCLVKFLNFLVLKKKLLCKFLVEKKNSFRRNFRSYVMSKSRKKRFEHRSWVNTSRWGRHLFSYFDWWSEFRIKKKWKKNEKPKKNFFSFSFWKIWVQFSTQKENMDRCDWRNRYFKGSIRVMQQLFRHIIHHII